MWITKRAYTQTKNYNKWYKRSLTTQSEHDYDKYIAVRNKCNNRIKNEHEKNISNECKTNPNGFRFT